MPRGVYDRSKKKSDSPEAPKAPKAKKQAKTAAAVSSPKAKKGGSVAGSPTVDTSLFFILRENIASLSHVRAELGNSDLGRKVEVEIAQNLSLLTKLRQDVFGKTEDEKIAQSEPTARVGNGTVAPTIPLPTNPMNIPPPPTA